MADVAANVSSAHTQSRASPQGRAPASAVADDGTDSVNQTPAENPIVRRAVKELKRRRLATLSRQQAVDNGEYQRLWREEILPHHVNHPAAPLWDCFVMVNNRSIEALSEHLSSDSQPWKSRAYKAAYPRLARFLKGVNLPLELTERCEVHFADFRSSAHAVCLHEWLSTEDATPDKYNIPRRRRNPEKVLDYDRLWACIKSRSRPLEQRIFYIHQTGTETVQVQELVPCRTLRIVDLTPTTAMLILASAPRLDLSYISSFFERYLKFSNWGRVNLISKAGDSKLKTYFLEYHFSFYHVPDVNTSSNTRDKDARDVRNVSPFTPGAKDGARSICEEQLSFLLVGHGGDVYTNIQLAEKYYVKVLEDDDQNMFNLLRPRGEEGDLPQRMPLFMGRGKPCATFLAWMSSSLLHVIARWQATIEAVESEIHTSFEDTFCGDKHSLLSDDSSFSRSRRYLWAIQVYKIFEQKLEETVTVWKEFEKNSLLKLYDPHMPHRDESLQTITRAVASLETKLAHVVRRREEITNLRDGLFATSQLLDSRLSVLQNDNIRLLTYVNLLFLPLAFCTSIFGMSTVLPQSVGAHTFVVTIVSVTIFTAFLVLNLQLLTELVKRLMGRLTIALRNLMQRHWRPSWRKTNRALENDVDAAEIPIQNRLRRSSHWMYLIFILETLLVSIPVHEIRAAADLWGLIPHLDAKAAASTAHPPIFSHGRQKDNHPDAYERQRRAEILERRRHRWKQTRQALATIPRIVLLPVWTALVFVELTSLLAWFSLLVVVQLWSKRPANSDLWWPSGPWRRALRLLGLSKDRGTARGSITFPPKIRQNLEKWKSKSQDTVTQTKAAKKAQAHHQRAQSKHSPQTGLTQNGHDEAPRDLEQGV